MNTTRFYMLAPVASQPIRRYPQREIYMMPGREWFSTAIPESHAGLWRVPNTLCLLLGVKGLDTV